MFVESFFEDHISHLNSINRNTMLDFRFKLENTFIKDSKVVLKEADIVGVIHDASNIYTRERLDIKAIKLLDTYKEKKSFLVLNKVLCLH